MSQRPHLPTRARRTPNSTPQLLQPRNCKASISTKTPVAIKVIRADRGPLRRPARMPSAVAGSTLIKPRNDPASPPPPANTPGTINSTAITPAQKLSEERSSGCFLALHHGMEWRELGSTTDTVHTHLLCGYMRVFENERRVGPTPVWNSARRECKGRITPFFMPATGVCAARSTS